MSIITTMSMRGTTMFGDYFSRALIAGIGPGRAIEVIGRVGNHDGTRVLYNPRYELL